jgi:hypothetical protein
MYTSFKMLIRINRGEPTLSPSLNVVVISLVNIVNFFLLPFVRFSPICPDFFYVFDWAVTWSRPPPHLRQNHLCEERQDLDGFNIWKTRFRRSTEVKLAVATHELLLLGACKMEVFREMLSRIKYFLSDHYWCLSALGRYLTRHLFLSAGSFPILDWHCDQSWRRSDWSESSSEQGVLQFWCRDHWSMQREHSCCNVQCWSNQHARSRKMLFIHNWTQRFVLNTAKPGSETLDVNFSAEGSLS